MSIIVLQYIFFYVLLLAAPFLFVLMGERALQAAWWLVRRRAENVTLYHYPLRSEEHIADCCIHAVAGLLVWCSLTLFLFCIPLSLPLAAAIPVALLLIGKRPSLSRLAIPFARDPHFLLWFIAHLGLGMSLISSVDGFQTPWRNNYGDLGFHVGSIFRLVFGPAGFPDYHVYAGEPFTYPFFINLWTAAHLSVFPKEHLLAPIFVMQWVLLWTLTYGLLRGNVRPVLPWAMLLLGGSYSYLFQNFPDVSSVYLPTLLSTIWIPQRSSIFGLAILCALVALQHRMKSAEHDESQNCKLFFASFASAAIVSLAIFAHTIFALWGLAYLAFLQFQRCFGEKARVFIGVVFILISTFVGTSVYLLQSAQPLEMLVVLSVVCILAFLFLLFSFILRNKHDSSYRISIFSLSWFLCGSLLAIPFLSLLVGKTSMLSLVPGWVYNLSPELAESAIYEAWSKLCTDGVFFVAPAFLALLLMERYSSFFTLLSFFLLSQVVRMAVWEFDQSKAVLAVLILLFAVWAWTEHKHALFVQFLGLLVVIPTLFELSRVIREAPHFTVFSQAQINEATSMRNLLPKRSIIATSPEVHNGTALLTGRPLFLGYRGTIWTHALPERERLEILQNIAHLADCPQYYAVPELCPRAIVYDEFASKFWKSEEPPEQDWLKLRDDLWLRKKTFAMKEPHLQ